MNDFIFPCKICEAKVHPILKRSFSETLLTLTVCPRCGVYAYYPILIPPEGYYDRLKEDPREAALEQWDYPNEDSARRTKWAYEKQLDLLEQHCPKGGRLLDVGCGQGFFLWHAQQRKRWEAMGIEISEQDVQLAKNKLGVNVIRATLQDLESERNSFDVLKLRHIVEHIPDPVEFLRYANNILKSGGLAIIEVPNEGSFQARYSRWKDCRRGTNYCAYSSLNPPFHLFGYTERTLRFIARRLDWKIVFLLKVNTGNSVWFPREPDIDSFRDFYAPHGWKSFLKKLPIDWIAKILRQEEILICFLRKNTL